MPASFFTSKKAHNFQIEVRMKRTIFELNILEHAIDNGTIDRTSTYYKIVSLFSIFLSLTNNK